MCKVHLLIMKLLLKGFIEFFTSAGRITFEGWRDWDAEFVLPSFSYPVCLCERRSIKFGTFKWCCASKNVKGATMMPMGTMKERWMMSQMVRGSLILITYLNCLWCLYYRRQWDMSVLVKKQIFLGHTQTLWPIQTRTHEQTDHIRMIWQSIQ